MRIEGRNQSKDRGKSEKKITFTRQCNLSKTQQKDLFKDEFCISLRFVYPQELIKAYSAFEHSGSVGALVNPVSKGNNGLISGPET